MKKIFVAILVVFSLSANAQQNTLLAPTFWQGKPDLAKIKAEVEKGNSPSQQNAGSFDPVVLAINGDAPADAIMYLLSQPGNGVDKPTHDSRNYLHWAANKGNVEIIAYLLTKGAKVDNEDSHGATPILFAAGSGQQNTRVYDLLTAKGVNLTKSLNAAGANALLLSIGSDPDFKLADYFVSKGLSLNSTDAAGNNIFSYAARSGNIVLLKKLIEKGIKPQPTAMLMAAQGGRRAATTLDVYQYLESLNLSPAVTGKNGENALHALVRKPNQNEIIQYFLAKGTDVNQADEEGNTVLMNAATASREIAVFDLLMPKVKNINQANEKGMTALTHAVRSNSPEIVNYLIGKGADAKVLDKAGNTLAAYAVESYRPQNAAPGGHGGPAPGATTGPGRGNGPKPEDFDDKIKALQAAGLDVKALQEKGNTLFHLAIAKNDIDLLKRVQDLGVDINAKNKEGFTALHRAAMISKDDKVLKHLLSLGAKKDARTDFDETAFDLATENESLKKSNVTVNFLKQ